MAYFLSLSITYELANVISKMELGGEHDSERTVQLNTLRLRVQNHHKAWRKLVTLTWGPETPPSERGYRT
jgi:hypothetical protein